VLLGADTVGEFTRTCFQLVYLAISVNDNLNKLEACSINIPD
jgi:hypothetical protein